MQPALGKGVRLSEAVLFSWCNPCKGTDNWCLSDDGTPIGGKILWFWMRDLDVYHSMLPTSINTNPSCSLTNYTLLCDFTDIYEKWTLESVSTGLFPSHTTSKDKLWSWFKPRSFWLLSPSFFNYISLVWDSFTPPKILFTLKTLTDSLLFRGTQPLHPSNEGFKLYLRFLTRGSHIP